MKRHLRRIAICLLLGVVTTVAVAWGCAAWSVDAVSFYNAPEWTLWPVEAGEDGYELVNCLDRAPGQGMKLSQFELHGFGFTRISYCELPEQWYHSAATPAYFPPEDWLHVVTQTRCGWPSTALRCYEVVERDIAKHVSGPSERDRYPLHGGFDIPQEIDLGRPLTIARPLPLLPSWPGFLLDTLFYGILWFALLFGFTSTRRAVRRRRRRCAACGYDLRHAGHVRCPECGRETSKSRNVEQLKSSPSSAASATSAVQSE